MVYVLYISVSASTLKYTITCIQIDNYYIPYKSLNVVMMCIYMIAYTHPLLVVRIHMHVHTHIHTHRVYFIRKMRQRDRQHANVTASEETLVEIHTQQPNNNRPELVVGHRIL